MIKIYIFSIFNESHHHIELRSDQKMQFQGQAQQAQGQKGQGLRLQGQGLGLQ